MELFHLRYWDFAAAILLILIAILVRVVVLYDRAVGDPLFDPLPSGSDQLTYVTQAEQFEAGAFPTTPFRYQPGFTYYLIASRAITGDSLVMMRLTLSALNGVVCGAVVASGWMLSRRRWGGYLAGALFALYPVAIFQATELLVEGLALALLCVFVWLTLWQREKLAIWRSLILGLTMGYAIITRTNVALLLGAWFIWLAMLHWRRWRTIASHAAATLVGCVIVILPVTAWNYYSSGGQFQLITNVGAEEIYRANNRDGDGTYIAGNHSASLTADEGYINDLLIDIKLYPVRFIELQLRKLGIYFSDSEPGNNIDYYDNGEFASSLLAAIPLDFRILAALGLLGTIMLYWQDRRAGIYMALLNVAIFAGIMIIWVVSRLKVLAIVPLILSAPLPFLWLYDRIHQRDFGDWRRTALAAAAVGTFLLFCTWALDNLPRKITYAAVPDDAVPANILFGAHLRLVGWRYPSDWPAGRVGWEYTYKAFAVELFWQVDARVNVDYQAFLAYLDDGIRYNGRDVGIGEVSYPPLPTSQWQPGVIYAEIMGFRLNPDFPLANSGEVRLGVYELDAQTRAPIVVPITQPVVADDLTLTWLAAYREGFQPSPPENLTLVEQRFTDTITLQAFVLPPMLADDKPFEMTLVWSAIAEVSNDVTRFLHVVNAAGELVVTYDAPPDPELLSANWQPNYPIIDTIQLGGLPSGEYQLYVGLYDTLTQQRLATNATDNRPLLTTIIIP